MTEKTDINWIQLEGVGIQTRDSTAVAIAEGGSARIPSPMQLTEFGVALGPLVFEPFKNTLVLDSLEYVPKEDESILSALPLIGGAGLGASATRDTDEDTSDDEPVTVSRRDVLKVSAIGGALMTMGVSSAAAADSEYLVAEFDVQRNPSGFELSIHDIVDEVLPESTYTVIVDDSAVGEFYSGVSDNSLLIEPETTGTVKVMAESEAPVVDKLLGGLREPEMQWTIDLGTPADEIPEDEAVVIDDGMIAGVVSRIPSSDLALTLGETSIPHEDESDDHPRGNYRVRDGALEYLAGNDPPHASTGVLALHNSIASETLDDANILIRQ